MKSAGCIDDFALAMLAAVVVFAVCVVLFCALFQNLRFVFAVVLDHLVALNSSCQNMLFFT